VFCVSFRGFLGAQLFCLIRHTIFIRADLIQRGAGIRLVCLLHYERLGIAWLSLACGGGVQIVTTLLTISLRRHDVGRKTRLVAGVPRGWTRRYTTSRDWRDTGEDERWAVPGYEVQHAEAADGQSGEPDHGVETAQFEAMAVLPVCVYRLDMGCIR
jgi:hypothetical protein